jgi:hypothetical protein
MYIHNAFTAAAIHLMDATSPDPAIRHIGKWHFEALTSQSFIQDKRLHPFLPTLHLISIRDNI